ncbi:MAG: carboxypeptidase-like regulatory domain-containing protein [Acidobacteria bacterium]|nr:carboxypeptidase-like regulatory domain-containing protein [Acidobacteriota bacterium]
MISLLLFALLAPQPTGSISGLVKDSESGNPLTEVEVRAAPGGATAKTDAEGRYTIKDLAPRTYRVTAAASLDGHPGFGASATKTVHLTSARDLTSIDFSLRAMGEISGRVLDEEKEPLPDISVFLVTREYGLGTLRYVFSGMARTDDQGRYRLKRVIPGQGFLVTAQKRTLKLDPVSDVPSDPKLRKRAWVPGYYPDSPSIEGAQLLVLRPGEKREAIDLRLSRSPSYCIEGVLATGTGPAALKFELEQRRPTSGASGDGGFYTVAPGGTTGPDGKLRLCNLYPGDFTITAMQAPGFFGTTPVSITDSDVGNVRTSSTVLHRITRSRRS